MAYQLCLGQTVHRVHTRLYTEYTPDCTVYTEYTPDCTQSTHQIVHRVHTRQYTPHFRGIQMVFNIFKQRFLFTNSQRFKEYRCKSGVALFAWRINWNYAYSPLESGMCDWLYLMAITIIKYVSKNTIARPLFVPYYTPILSWDSFSFLMFMFSRNLYISTLDKTLKTIIRNLFRLLLIFSVPYNYKLYILGSIQLIVNWNDIIIYNLNHSKF